MDPQIEPGNVDDGALLHIGQSAKMHPPHAAPLKAVGKAALHPPAPCPHQRLALFGFQPATVPVHRIPGRRIPMPAQPPLVRRFTVRLVQVDINGYRVARRTELAKIAQEAVKRVLATGETVSLEAMNPFERKVCHDVVAAEGLFSESEGTEPHRHVVVMPAEEDVDESDDEESSFDDGTETPEQD